MTRIADIELGEFPILLAPMEDVSDPPFRYVCKQHGADLVFTEFISAEGLIRNARKSMKKLEVFDYERPVGIQIFGANIDAMRVSTVIAEKQSLTLLILIMVVLLKMLLAKEPVRVFFRTCQR